jgi:arylsulfatase A-like enzyme
MRSIVFLSSALAASATKKPHLVFILVDDMGFNDFYQSTEVGSAWREVAKLAQEDCVAIDHYYTQPICTPTRGAFMSGRMPVRLGLQHEVIDGFQNYGLPLDEATLADKLKDAGYNTIGVGKWHLGMYNNASTPTRRGFNHFYGYLNGMEDYYTHKVGGYLDLNDDGEVDYSKDGMYSTQFFAELTQQRIREHKSAYPDTPLFLYVPMQNVHSPNEAPDSYTGDAGCASVENSQRKIFCGMARAADEVIGNITSTLDETFPGEDVVVVIGGDNGGQGGGNCPEYSQDGLCLRGQKATLWEGGIRNNALLCSKTLLPSSLKGQTYSKGLVHVMDWHATFRDLAGSKDKEDKPLDGLSVWDAILADTDSPRKEFLVNVDPCSGHGACAGEEFAFRYQGCVGSDCGDWKLVDTPSGAGWIPVVDVYQCSGHGGCEAPSDWSGSGTPGRYSDPSNWGVQLFNLEVDPNEENNLAATYPKVLSYLQDRVSQLRAEDDLVDPCNIPGGTCADDDPNGEVVAEQHGAWFPWSADPAEKVLV